MFIQRICIFCGEEGKLMFIKENFPFCQLCLCFYKPRLVFTIPTVNDFKTKLGYFSKAYIFNNIFKTASKLWNVFSIENKSSPVSSYPLSSNGNRQKVMGKGREILQKSWIWLFHSTQTIRYFTNTQNLQYIGFVVNVVIQYNYSSFFTYTPWC